MARKRHVSKVFATSLTVDGSGDDDDDLGPTASIITHLGVTHLLLNCLWSIPTQDFTGLDLGLLDSKTGVIS